MSIIQFKRDKKQNSNKLHLDQYFTSSEVAKHCIEKTFEVIGKENITQIIEPSAGNGVFVEEMLKINPYYNILSYDIEPKKEGIEKLDFLNIELDYKDDRLVIGNPPYGSRLNLAKSFCNKSFEIAKYVSFILPISQLNNNQSIYKYDLIYSEDLGEQLYSGRLIHCCLNIYKKPEGKRYNKKINYKNTDIIEIREIRETVKNDSFKENKKLGDFKYDIAICAWGSIGKELKDGQNYAKTFYIKIKDDNNYEYYKNLILQADWKNLYPMTNTPNLLQWQVYKYVLEHKK